MQKHWRSTVIIAALLSASPTLSATLAEWTFETTLPTTSGPHAAEGGLNAGAGSPATGFHANGATVWSNPAGNGSAESFSSTAWSIGDYYQFATSTTGYVNIGFSWDQTRSGTGPTTFDLEYSLDGTNFTTLVNDYTVLENTAANGGAWNSSTRILNYAFGPIAAPALSNQPIAYFRLTNQLAPGGSGGTSRVDNIQIIGDLLVYGACCRSGVCTIETASECTITGGIYQGDNSQCDPSPCLVIIIGACCRNGACTIETESACTTSAGQWQGVDTTCDPNPCPPPTGACCRVGACTIEAEAACTGNNGTYQGDGTNCDPNPCPPPTGACCVAGCCIDVVSQAACDQVGGQFFVGQTCGSIPACPQTAAWFFLSELFINPPGSGDSGREFVEISGTPGAALLGYWFIVLEGDASGAGTVDQLINLGTYSTGASGLLLIRDDPAGPAFLPAIDPLTNVVFRDFVPDIENGGNTYILAKGIPAFAGGADLDTNNDGALDAASLPGLCVLDSVSYVEAGTAGQQYADDLGGAALGDLSLFTPDALYRLLDCSGAPVRWAAGDIADPIVAQPPWPWDPNENTGFLPDVDPATLTLDGGQPNYRICPPATGACCRSGVCTTETEADCTANGGAYEGDGTVCDPNPCPPPVCLGDADCDGDVDFFDIDPFVAKLGCPGAGPECSDGCPWQNSDVDQDGDVDFFDIDPFVARLGNICP